VATERVHQDPSLRAAGELLAELDVEPALGLSAEQAGARLARYGPNELRTAPRVPRWRKVLAQFQDPLIYLLLTAIAVSVVAWVAEGARGVPVDAVVIAVIVVANAVLGRLQEGRAEDAVAVRSR
jgi:Ca2+-transporting ATPase